MTDEPVFKIGDFVEKYTGDYTWHGVISAAFTTPAGHQRYVVAHRAGTGWVLHIYSGKNLRKAPS